MKKFAALGLSVSVALILAATGGIAEAQGRPVGGGGGGDKGGPGGGKGGGPTVEGYYSWMHPDVALAFSPGDLGGAYTGVGSHLIVVDSFDGAQYSGNLDGTTQALFHGEWTTLQASLVAPDASRAGSDSALGGVDYDSNINSSITSYYSATSGDLNVVNLSFALAEDVNATSVNLGALGDSIVDQAFAGSAVFVKAAGNTNGGALTDPFAAIIGGQIVTVYDALNEQLIGADGAIFVGALTKDGDAKKQASMARYSTVAGDNVVAQQQFLVVGVKSGDNGGLEGTSFAAPIVSGYAALLGDKFDTATPVQVVDQLLSTARTDTIRNYSASIHGMGEACLSCALSPASIPQ
ncbi:S8 family serine peptidase [Ovoidimarina sediminis]|uniref:S8 family serine peptidase n=1 Tax=Ovoidimarina sediminis TaxID=3079856 RepID=UPI002910505A|nr:S8 family serine peptidase [Rhodophyticola sp. MJ-SS7]MDU8945061.1 S8 family serine peptidase [Rhodophyticola sp. MJ-SS7]